MRQATYDGTVDIFAEVPGSIYGIATDAGARSQYLYAANISSLRPSVSRVHVDTLEITPVLDDVGPLRTIAIDEFGQKLYYFDGPNDRFMRANLDGSGLEESVLIDNPNPDLSFDVDSAGGWIYWVGRVNLIRNGIWRAPLAGGEKELIVAPTLGELGIHPHTLALDLIHGHLYWSEGMDLEEPEFGGGRIRRANLDGSDPHTVLRGLNPTMDAEGYRLAFFNPDYMVIDPVAGLMFVSNTAEGTIARANLDGSNADSDFIRDVGAEIRGMAIIATVPEPSTFALAGAGVVLLAAMRLWRRLARGT